MALPEKILLIQLFSNGDCLYATAVARQVKQDYPGCHLTWVVAAYCQNILSKNPYIDELLLVEDKNINSWKTLPAHLVDRFNLMLQEGSITKIIQTQLIGDRYAQYDQCIRSSIFSGYDKPVTVSVAPVIQLSNIEKNAVEEFSSLHQLQQYRHVVLLEYAPKSGQSDFTADKAMLVGRELTKQKDIAVIFGSGGNVEMENKQMISAQQLSLRQVAYLTNYCTFFAGCSSGITWAATSGISKKLPTLQILNPDAYWLNSVVNDHKHFNLSVDHIIEITESSVEHILSCIGICLNQHFDIARSLYNRRIVLKFRMTRGIIVSLLHKRNFKGVAQHIKINFKKYGFNYYFIKAIVLGFVSAPFTRNA